MLYKSANGTHICGKCGSAVRKEFYEETVTDRAKYLVWCPEQTCRDYKLEYVMYLEVEMLAKPVREGAMGAGVSIVKTEQPKMEVKSAISRTNKRN